MRIMRPLIIVTSLSVFGCGSSAGGAKLNASEETPSAQTRPSGPSITMSALTNFDRLETSLAKWRKLADENGDTYTYEAHSVQTDARRYSTATVFVDDGVVVRRDFKSIPYDFSGSIPVAWSEDSTTLGSHDGAPDPKTIDELHEQCRTEVLTRESQGAEILFDVDTRGVVRLCVVVDADKQVHGFSIFPASFASASSCSDAAHAADVRISSVAAQK